MDSKNYWVEYYEGGMRRRERIGRSKQAAENRLRGIQTAKAEGRHIRRNKNAEVTLGELRSWYLGLSEVRQRLGTAGSFAASHSSVCDCSHWMPPPS